jgi:hypothetical protein
MSNEEKVNDIRLQQMTSEIVNSIETLTLGNVVDTQLNIRKIKKKYVSEYPGSRPSNVNKCSIRCEMRIYFNATIALKAATCEGKEELKRQVHTLMDIEPDLTAYVPKVIGFDLERDLPYFIMPFYPYPSLRDLVFVQNASEQTICRILEKLLEFMFEKIYQKEVHAAPFDYVVSTHFNKIRKRLFHLGSLSGAFDSLINANTIRINSEPYENILPLLDHMQKTKELMRRLQPPKINMIHGDLEFAHVLVSIKDTNSPSFVLLDPRIPMGGSDIAYDLGKLWQTFHGFLDLIASDRFLIGKRFATKDTITYDAFELLDEKILDVLHRVDKTMCTLLTKYQEIKNDPYLLMRTIFSCAAHICSAGPFYLKNDGKEKVAVALYLKGTQLLNDFYRGNV